MRLVLAGKHSVVEQAERGRIFSEATWQRKGGFC